MNRKVLFLQLAGRKHIGFEMIYLIVHYILFFVFDLCIFIVRVLRQI